MSTRMHRAARTATAAVLAALLVLLPMRADAHSLESTTVSLNLASGTPEATLTLPLPALAEALGTTPEGVDTDAATSYVADHFRITSADGTAWSESFHDATLTTVEGIASFRVGVDLDNAGASLSDFTISYDAVVEAVPGQEAVVVLTDTAGDISTAGVIAEAGDVVTIGDGGAGTAGIVDMVQHGTAHVLAGADHLLFLLVLLLPAALVVGPGRHWRSGKTPRQTLRQVLGVVTAFTVGHSITLVTAGLGLVTVPSRPVEVLIAVSVALGAVHAIRPVLRRGEQLIAGSFGLIHGLAFAAILSSLDLQGTTAIGPLLAFNVGVELAQLLVVGLVFPSIFLIGRTRFERPARRLGAGLAITVASAWVLDRTGLFANPFAGVENALITHPWPVVTTLALAAITLAVVDRARPPTPYPRTPGGTVDSGPSSHGNLEATTTRN